MKRKAIFNISIAVTALLVGAAGVVTISGCGHSIDFSQVQTFQQAQQIYDEAKTPDDFQKAASLYQKILDSGTVSGAVLFNQGNAYMRAGMRGHAIAAYRQAKQFRPGDPYLEANLASTLGTRSDQVRRPLIEHLFFWQNRISYATKYYLTALLATMTLVFAVAQMFSRPVLRPVAVVLLVSTLVMLASTAYDWQRYDLQRHGVITSTYVVARKGNGESYQPAFNQPLEEGTEFRVTGERGDWIRIRLPEGQDGWISSKDAAVY